MGVKYVKDFSYPKHMGFHEASEPMSQYAKGGRVAMPAKAKASAKDMPARAKPNAPAHGAAKMMSKPKMGKGQGYAEGGRVPGYDMDRLPAKKPPGRTMDLAPSKPERGEYQGYAKGGMTKGEKKIGKVMGEYKRGELHSGSKKGPKVKSREQAIAIALSEARKAGAKIPKKADGGVMGGPTSYAESGSAGGSDVTFKEAFRKARQQGLKEFSWRGDKYSTKLKEEVKRETKTEEKAPKAEASRKAPESRKEERSKSTSVSVKSKDETPGRRYSGEYGEMREVMSSLSPSQKKEALATGALGAASMALPTLRLAGAGSRTGQVGVRGMTLAQRERDAEAAAKAAERVSALRKAAEGRARMGRGAVYAEGGMVDRSKASSLKGKGIFDNEYLAYGDKKVPYRGSPKKGKMLGRQDRLSREAMERAEKYAPGMSLDMKAKGGMAKHKDVKMDKEVVRKAVHKHESAMHPGKPKTKLRHGGMFSYGRKPMYGSGN